MKKQILLGAGIAVGGAVLLRSAYERSHLVTDTFVLQSPKLQKSHTLVFLSDLHNNRFGEGQKDLLEAIEAAGPEAILVGGDMIIAKREIRDENAWELFKALAGNYPIFYGDGNHESRLIRKRFQYGDGYEKLTDRLKRMGITYLHNASAELGEEIRITGFDIPRKYYCKFTPPPMPVRDVEEKVGKASAEKYQILLAHTPCFPDTYADWGADLTLSGHFHGGTIRLPWLGGVMTPQFQFFEPLCGGLHGTGEKKILVSRGLGTHSIDLRLNNPSELIVLQLQPKALE